MSVRVPASDRTKIKSVVEGMTIDGSTIEDGTITTAELGGDITTAGKALLDDANAAAQRTTLGLGTAATTAASAYATASHTHAASDITSGTIGTARLGSGTASSASFLRGDQSWQKTWNVIAKTSDESRQSSIVQTADSTLQFSMAANTVYRIRMTVFYTSDATADFMYSLSGPTSPTGVALRYSHVTPGSTANTNFVVAGASGLPASQQINGTTTDPGYITFDLMWNNGSNTGTFAFLWSQRVSTAVNTTVLAGSTLEYMLVADLGA